MEDELVSIITPTYNCAKFIGRTIDSVLKQTYTNWEMIIVDDASKDNTEEIVLNYKDPRIKYIKLEKNAGPANARNKSMQEAKGKYIAFLDSDDIWMPEKLEKQIKFMKVNGYNMTATSYEHINEQDEKLNKIVKCKEKVDYNGMLLSCPVGNSTVMYNVGMLGKFEVPDIKKRNDYALWLKMLKKEKYVYGLDDVLMEYRIREKSVSSNKFALVKYHWYLYRKIEHLSIIRSAFHVCYFAIMKIFKLK